MRKPPARCPIPPWFLLLDAAALPRPKPEFRFAPPRRWRFDFAWPEHRVALEIEGGIWTRGRHTRGPGFLADMEKYNAAALAGWRVLRATPKQLASGAVLLLLKVALTVDTHGGDSGPDANGHRPSALSTAPKETWAAMRDGAVPRKTIVVKGRIGQGGFSGERVVKVASLDGTERLVLAPAHYCWNENGERLRPGEPVGEMNGLVAAQEIGRPPTGGISIATPDGERFTVRTEDVADRPLDSE